MAIGLPVVYRTYGGYSVLAQRKGATEFEEYAINPSLHSYIKRAEVLVLLLGPIKINQMIILSARRRFAVSAAELFASSIWGDVGRWGACVASE